MTSMSINSIICSAKCGTVRMTKAQNVIECARIGPWHCPRCDEVGGLDSVARRSRRETQRMNKHNNPCACYVCNEDEP